MITLLKKEEKEANYYIFFQFHHQLHFENYFELEIQKFLASSICNRKNKII